jgi:hypothetical protein
MVTLYMKIVAHPNLTLKTLRIANTGISAAFTEFLLPNVMMSPWCMGGAQTIS